MADIKRELHASASKQAAAATASFDSVLSLVEGLGGANGCGESAPSPTAMMTNGCYGHIPADFDAKDTRSFNNTLIRIVKASSALYDQQHALYKNNDARVKIWEEIGAALGLNTETLRTRWKTLRDRFKKEWRKEEINLPTVWAHYEEMAFLKPFLKEKQGPDTPSAGAADLAGGSPPQSHHQFLHGFQHASTNNYLLELAMNSIASAGGAATHVDEPPLARKRAAEQHGSNGHVEAASSRTPAVPKCQRDAAHACKNGADAEEDELFCRLVLKKLRRMDEHTKERAKAKMMDLLVKVMYPHGENGS